MAYGYTIVEVGKRREGRDGTTLTTVAQSVLDDRRLYEKILDHHGDTIVHCRTSGAAIKVSQDVGILGQAWIYAKTETIRDSAADTLRGALSTHNIGLEKIK